MVDLYPGERTALALAAFDPRSCVLVLRRGHYSATVRAYKGSAGVHIVGSCDSLANFPDVLGYDGREYRLHDASLLPWRAAA